MNVPKLIARNVTRNRRRALLTVMTIALATFVYTILASVPASMDRILADASTTLRLLVNNRTAPWYDLPARYCDQIRKMPGCAACVALTGWFGSYKDPHDIVFANAVGPELSDVFPDYDFGRQQRAAMTHEKRGAVVGEVLMKKYHWKIGQQITLQGGAPDRLELTFIIVGTIKPKHYPNAFVFRRDYLQEARKAMGKGDEDIAWNLFVRADSPEHLTSLAKTIDETFRNSDYETRTVTESDALSNGLSALGDVRAIILSLCIVVILTVLLIAANSSAMAVRERIGEIAVMRALGFDAMQIGRILFGECILTGAAGGAIGAGVAYWMFSGGVTLGAVLQGNGALWVTPASALGGLAVAIGVSVLSGLVPILAAIRTAPAVALRAVV